MLILIFSGFEPYFLEFVVLQGKQGKKQENVPNQICIQLPSIMLVLTTLEILQCAFASHLHLLLLPEAAFQKMEERNKLQSF